MSSDNNWTLSSRLKTWGPGLALRLFLFGLLLAGLAENRRHSYKRYRSHNYQLTLSIRNHNVTDAKFFRLIGVDNTADFYVAPGKTFTKTYDVNRKGYWTLFVEFPNDRYAKSPSKIISRDSYSHWIMEVYYYPGSVGFSEWHKMRKRKYRHYRVID